MMTVLEGVTYATHQPSTHQNPYPPPAFMNTKGKRKKEEKIYVQDSATQQRISKSAHNQTTRAD